jgi:hypothetical protein
MGVQGVAPGTVAGRLSASARASLKSIARISEIIWSKSMALVYQPCLRSGCERAGRRL